MPRGARYFGVQVYGDESSWWAGGYGRNTDASNRSKFRRRGFDHTDQAIRESSPLKIRSEVLGPWEKALAEEGLSVLDTPGGISNRDNVLPRSEEAADAVDEFRDWAKRALGTATFRNQRARRAFELYAEGKPYSDIIAELGMSHGNLQKLVARVKRQVPPTVGNPWRKLPAGQAEQPTLTVADLARACSPEVTARLLEMAVETSDRGRLAEMVAADDDLRKLGGSLMPQLQQYTQIRIRKGFEVRWPGVNLHKDCLLPKKGEKAVEGRPHAGGIDVVVDGVTVTVPWWKIEEAPHARGE